MSSSTKQNQDPTSLDISSAKTPNHCPNFSTNLSECFEDLMSENSPKALSLIDTTEIKTTTFGTSVQDKYRRKEFLADAESSQKCQEFTCVSKRVLQTSLPNFEAAGNAPSNWVHEKFFKQNMGQMKFHQLIILPIWEMRRVLSSLDEILEAKRQFLKVLESQFLQKMKRWVQQANSSLHTIQPLWRIASLITISRSYVKQPNKKYLHLSPQRQLQLLLYQIETLCTIGSCRKLYTKRSCKH